MTTTAKSFWAKISAVQIQLIAELKTTEVALVKSSRGTYQYEYIGCDDFLRMLLPILAKNNLAHSCSLTVHKEHGVNWLVVGIYDCDSDEHIESTLNLGVTPDQFQVLGGKLTYYRTRLTMALLGVHPEPDATEQQPDAYVATNPVNRVPGAVGNMPQMPPHLQGNRVPPMPQMPPQPPSTASAPLGNGMHGQSYGSVPLPAQQGVPLAAPLESAQMPQYNYNAPAGVQ